jgi:pyrophosphatase PpaX
MGTLLKEPANLTVALARFEEFHAANSHRIRPFSGVAALLVRLREAGVGVALWTGRDRVSTEILLGEHQLKGYFATAVCGDDLPSHKPDSAGLKEIMRRLQVAPSETLLVGDADVDVLGGVGGGVDTLLIRHGRVVQPEIMGRSWRSVLTPSEAFELLLTRIQAAA